MEDSTRPSTMRGFVAEVVPTSFDERQSALLYGAGVVETWQRGAVLMRQGEQADRAILLEQGTTKVVSESLNGYTSLLAFRGPGELVGELACLDGGVRSASVVATTSGCGVIVAAARFARLLESDGGLALAVLRSISARLRHADAQREALGADSAAVRVGRLLVEIVARHGVAAPGWAPAARSVLITQQELAAAVGTSRESVVRTLRELQLLELVATGRGVIVVLDPAGLAAWDPDRK